MRGKNHNSFCRTGRGRKEENKYQLIYPIEPYEKHSHTHIHVHTHNSTNLLTHCSALERQASAPSCTPKMHRIPHILFATPTQMVSRLVHNRPPAIGANPNKSQQIHSKFHSPFVTTYSSRRFFDYTERKCEEIYKGSLKPV